MNQKILIVDDKPENLYVLERILVEVDAMLIRATSGNEALKATLNHDFALAILDVQMPGMDGYELAEIMRSEENTRYTPIIFLSAVFSDEFHIFRGYASGAVDFITKPIVSEILLSKVKVFLEMDRHKKELVAHKNRLEALVVELEDTNAQLNREIIERKRAEERIKAALAEKEVLVREIHHRVKNNLQSLIYLIDMQTENIESPAVVRALEDLQRRTKTMAMIHEQLYRAEDLSQIDFKGYLEELAMLLLDALGRGRNIALRVEADALFTNIEIAIPCGLIVNELVSNALKYAFSEDKAKNRDAQAEIRVEFGIRKGEYMLTVSDNGIGLPPELDWRATETLGLKLANIWATHQLGGSIEMSNRHGATFTIKFPERK